MRKLAIHQQNVGKTQNNNVLNVVQLIIGVNARIEFSRIVFVADVAACIGNLHVDSAIFLLPQAGFIILFISSPHVIGGFIGHVEDRSLAA